MMNSLGESWQEAWGSEEEQEDGEVQADYEQRVSGTFAQMLEEMHDLQSLCRVLQPRELPLEKEERSLMVFDRLQAEPLKSLMETAAVIVTREERKPPLGYYMACNGKVGEGIGQSAFVLRSTAVSPVFSAPSSAVLLKKSLGK
ncbi:hypothetical protein Q8A67_011850 [Cirrhinus molitorella]|uniref:Uncharacterized protein n=2 Tax=Cirrhinus molitorella TaxID=172907 RepID=A0AA88TQ32_9TELE|nr:hypothetical protein Q8A67_011850 [Cirrhinus molitorella]